MMMHLPWIKRERQKYAMKFSEEDSKLNGIVKPELTWLVKELFVKMREAGCIAVWFGVESGSKTVLTSMGKGFSLTQTRRAFKWAKEAGLMTVAGVILGFPGETKESAWETIQLCEGT